MADGHLASGGTFPVMSCSLRYLSNTDHPTSQGTNLLPCHLEVLSTILTRICELPETAGKSTCMHISLKKGSTAFFHQTLSVIYDDFQRG